MSTKVLTPEQVADRLQVPVSWVYRAAREGKLRKLEGLGRYVRFDGREIGDWIDSQRSERLATDMKTAPALREQPRAWPKEELSP